MFVRLTIVTALLLAVVLPSSAQPFDLALYSPLKWRCIGPFRGGRTVGATGVAGQPNLFYIGVNNGGVWKTTDAGRVWTPIFDDQPTGSIGALAVAPSNPKVIYVGSGEGLQRPDLSTGDGVYKSIDGGKTWTNTGLRDGQQISAVIVDVAFPTFARLRHERERLIGQLVSFTRLNLITVMLYSAIVFVAAPDVIAVLFPKYHGAEDAVRILGAVAILRSVSLMIPPLLDGIGHPNRTLVYTATAAVVLPIVWVISAITLRQLGFMSVAIGWGIGYPVAFAVLIWLAMASLGWSWVAYFRVVRGVAACLIGAGIAAAGVHLLLGGVPPWVRLLVTSVTVTAVAGVLLAYTQGLSLRTARRALRGEAVPELAPDVAPTEMPNDDDVSVPKP